MFPAEATVVCFTFSFSGEAKIIDLFFFLTLFPDVVFRIDLAGVAFACPENGFGVSTFLLMFLALLSRNTFSIRVSPPAAAGAVAEVTEVEDSCLVTLLLEETELVEDAEELDTSRSFNLDCSIFVANLTEEVDDTEDLWLMEFSESASEVFLLFDVFNIPILTDPFFRAPFV